MKSFLERAFGVRPEEAPLVVSFFGFFTLIGMFYTVGCTVGDTLFLSSLPAGRVPAALPWVYAGVGAANIAAALAFDALSARLSRRVMMVSVQLLLAASVLAFRQLIELGWPPLYYALVIWMELAAILSITLFFSFAGDYFTPRDARRLYGFIAGGMALGTVVSGQAIQLAVPFVGTKNLLYGGGLILLANAAIALHILRIGTPVVHEGAHDLGEPERAPLRAVFARPYVRYLGVVIPLAIAIGVVVDYQMKWAASAKSESELAHFFGAFFAWVGLAQMIFQFLLVPRLLHRLGIINCLLILPLTLGVASLLLVGSPLPLLFGAALVNSLRMTISETLDVPSRELLFLPLPTRIRVRAQPLLVGAVAPATQGVTALCLLALYALGVRVERLSLIAALLSAVLVLALVRLRPRYRETLASTLREHQLDPTDLERILQSPTVTPVLEDLLRSDDPEVARATLDLIADRDLSSLQGVLRELVDRPHVPVAIAALQLLVRARGPELTQVIERALESSKREVRRAAVLALCEVSGVDALPRVRDRLSSTDRSLRNSAIIGVARHCGEQGLRLARPDLEARARSKHTAERVEAAELLGDIGLPGHADLLGPLLDDGQEDVRKAATEACAKIADPELLPLLIAKLRDAALQSSVLRALERTPPGAVAPLVTLLGDTTRPVSQRSMVVRVLARIGGAEAIAALVTTLDRGDEITLRLATAQGLLLLKARGAAPALSAVDERIESVCEAIELRSRAHDEVGALDELTSAVYREHADLHVSLLLCLVALETDPAQVERIRWNLFRDPESSGMSALELLDALLPRRLGPRVLATLTYWLETRKPKGGGLRRETQARLRRADTWMRAITAHHESRSAQASVGDSAPLSMTLAEAQLYQLLDVVSFLKRVPLFRDLRADTLAEQAEICEWVAARAGDALFDQGDQGDALYVICDGEVRVVVDGKDVATLGVGQCIGDLALLDDEPRSASAVATVDTRLLRVSAERWKALLMTQPAVAKAMLRTLDQRIRETQASIKSDAKDEPPMRRSQMFRAQNLGLSELISTMSFLQQVELFAELDTPELANLAGIAQEVPVLEGDILFEEGDLGESLYLVCTGSIAIDVGGREVARLSRGACLGEMALISGLPRSASARAVHAGKLLRIGSDDFASLLESRPEIAIALLRTFAQRLRRASRRAA